MLALMFTWISDWKNIKERAHSCPREWRVSASWGPNWGNKPPQTSRHNGISRCLRGAQLTWGVSNGVQRFFQQQIFRNRFSNNYIFRHQIFRYLHFPTDKFSENLIYIYTCNVYLHSLQIKYADLYLVSISISNKLYIKKTILSLL